MKSLKFLLILIITSLAFSQNFEVTEDIRETPNDRAAVAYPHDDNAGNPCALVKLFSNVEGLSFENPMALEKEIEKGKGEYWLYMKHGARYITIKKSGFLPLTYPFPIGSLQRSTTYRMSVTGVGEQATISEIAIVVQADPSDAKVFINDKEMPEPDRIITTLGKQTLKVTRDGYEPYITEIDVTPTNIRFPAKLERVKEVGIVIRSEPQGALVFIDGFRYSETPFTEFHKTGSYQIRLVLDGYIEHTETIEIKEPRFEKTFRLVKNEGSIRITTIPEKGLDIYIDGRKTEHKSDATITGLRPGKYKIKAQSQYYESEEKEFEVIIGQTGSVQLQTEANFGTLTINTHPNAQVFLNENRITDLKNIRLVPQRCNIEVRMNKAEPVKESFLIAKGENIVKNLYPSVKTGTVRVAVYPDDADILLAGDDGETFTAKGMNIFNDVPVGNYTLTVKAKGHKTYTRKFKVELNKTVDATGITLEKGTDLKIDMILVEGGTFNREGNRVTVSDFYIGKTEVTQAQYQAVMGTNPSHFKGNNLPVESVTWFNAIEFCNKLSEMQELQKVYTISGTNVTSNWNANGYRLPTEAEWEFAARGGIKASKGFFGGYKYEYSGSNNVGDVAWYSSNSGSKTQPVGTKQPNELGIYDMSGNVWEWCWDWYTEGTNRVLRGGSWISNDGLLRCANRYDNYPYNANYNVGFRLSRTK